MILNLTQHKATDEQLAAGVVDLTGGELSELKGLLTFNTLPEKKEIENRAKCIAELALCHKAHSAMIGGAPFLMGALENALKSVGIVPLYAFSVRESVETTAPDGSISKVGIFRHRGFVEV